MGIEEAFLHDILAHPDDDAPRLIYADWLDERNDPRGEFIRVQCTLAQLSDEDPRRWPLEEREQELLREHGTKWLPQDFDHVSCFFRRGFVEKIALPLRHFPDMAGLIFERAPIRQLSLLEQSGGSSLERTHATADPDNQIRNAVLSPYMARLRRLRLGFSLNPEDLQSLVESPYLGHLSELCLECADLTLDALRLLVNSSSFTSLTHLVLSGNRLTHEAARVLAESRLLPQLEELHLDSNLLGDTGALIVRNWPALPRLTRLSLGHNQMSATGVKALTEAPALQGLISLDLARNISCDAGAVAMACSSWTRLQALNLWFNGVGDKGVRALASSEALSRLTRLTLTTNRISKSGAFALIKSPCLPRMVRLDLRRNDIGPAERRLLRERFGPFVYF